MKRVSLPSDAPPAFAPPSFPTLPLTLQVWSQRPLTSELCEYASTDVRYLHGLAEALNPRLGKDLADRVRRVL